MVSRTKAILRLFASFVIFSSSLGETRIYTVRVCQNETLNMNCLHGQGIDVKSALFGRVNDTMCLIPSAYCAGNSTVLGYLTYKCQYKRTCSIKPGHPMTGISPACYKYWEVKYACCQTDGIMKSEIVCKNQYEPLMINCGGAPNRIKIHDAVYGRGPCPLRGQQKNSQTLFHKNNVAAFVSEECDSKELCSAAPSQLFNRTNTGGFSDNIGYVFVSYQCFPVSNRWFQDYGRHY